MRPSQSMGAKNHVGESEKSGPEQFLHPELPVLTVTRNKLVGVSAEQDRNPIPFRSSECDP